MGEFREIINGYQYKLIDEILYDENMCSVNIEVNRYGDKTENPDEIDRYVAELITDIMNNHFEEKYKSFNTNGCLEQKIDNIYKLDWVIKMKKDKYKILKKFCEGNEVEILSGVLKNKKGKYVVKQQGNILKKIIEYVSIGNVEYELKGISFKFSDDYDQIAYEETINDR